MTAMSPRHITLKREDRRWVAQGPSDLMLYGAVVRATRKFVDGDVITISPRIIVLGETTAWINAGPRRTASRTCNYEMAQCANGDLKSAAFFVNGKPLCATCKVRESHSPDS